MKKIVFSNFSRYFDPLRFGKSIEVELMPTSSMLYRANSKGTINRLLGVYIGKKTSGYIGWRPKPGSKYKIDLFAVTCHNGSCSYEYMTDIYCYKTCTLGVYFYDNCFEFIVGKGDEYTTRRALAYKKPSFWSRILWPKQDKSVREKGDMVMVMTILA